MAARLRVVLDPAARVELVARFNASHDAETRLRYQMVLLAADGHTAPQVAPLVQRSVATVERVLHRFRTAGAAGVPHRRRPGRPSPAPPNWEAEWLRVSERDPHTVGVASANGTTELLAAYLACTTGHQTGIETVRTALHRAGYVCTRPRWVRDRKASAQEDWPIKESGGRRCSRRRHRPCLHP